MVLVSARATYAHQVINTVYFRGSLPTSLTADQGPEAVTKDGKVGDRKGKSGQGAMLMAGLNRMWEKSHTGFFFAILVLCLCCSQSMKQLCNLMIMGISSF